MFSSIRRGMLRVLRVPAKPVPPAGNEVRAFRPSPRFYTLRLLKWGGGQVATHIGLAVNNLIAGRPWIGFDGDDPIGTVIYFGIVWGIFVLAIPITFILIRLDYEQRWYLVTDRSLRVREGVVRVSERTVTFANVQKIEVKQGPLQRLLGIADLEVRSAGGGGGSRKIKPRGKFSGQQDTHVTYLRGISNAEEVRSMIRDRVRQYRDSGLGDLDDEPASTSSASRPAPVTALSGASLKAAAREFGAEARALRERLEGVAMEG